MDEIKIATILVGLRDFADRPDYCPKVMKEKLSECIKDLQGLYHADTVTMPRESFDKVNLSLDQAVQFAKVCKEAGEVQITEEITPWLIKWSEALEILKQYEVK